MRVNPNYSVIILPLRFRIKITVSLESYGADFKIVAKVVTDLDKIIMALNFMTRCSWLRPKPNDNQKPFGVTQQGKIAHWTNTPEDTATNQCG